MIPFRLTDRPASSRPARARTFKFRQLVGLLLMVASLWLMGWDAAHRRSRREAHTASIRAVVRLLGTADLALSSSSRWLRHPSITEPGAAFADGPAILDNDPAGAALGLPREVLAGFSAEPDVPPLMRERR